MSKLVTLSIRKVPESLRRELKSEAASLGLTMEEYAVKIWQNRAPVK